MRFPARWLCFAAGAVALEAGLLRAALLELGFDMDNPSADCSAEEGWQVLGRLAQLNAPHLEEGMAQKEFGRKLAGALREKNLIKPAHLRLVHCLPGPLRMLSLQKLASGTPFAYEYTRESAGLWKLRFEGGVLMPFSVGLWEVLSEWLGKRWVVSAGPMPDAVLFVQEV